MQGNDFVSSAISGFAGSLGAGAWGGLMKGVGLSKFAESTIGTVTFGALSGGDRSRVNRGKLLARSSDWRYCSRTKSMHKMSNGDDPPKVVKTKEIKSKEYSSSLKGSRGGAIAIIENIKEGPKLGQGPGIFVPSDSHSEVSVAMTFYDNNMVDVSMVISADRINTAGSYIVNYSVESSGKIVSSGILLDKGLGISSRMGFPIITKPGVNILSTVGGIRVPVNSILKVNIGLLGKYPAGGTSSISTRHIINIK